MEAVHICGLCGGFEALGLAVEIVGPPGVVTDPDVVVSAETGQTGTIWGRIARQAPQLLFECMEVGYNLVAVPRLLKACRSQRPALIYERYSLYNAAGVIAGWLTRTPVVLEINDTVKTDRTRQGKGLRMPWLAQWFERRIFRRASGAAVVSEYLRDQVAQAGIPRERILVTPNAVDPRRFDPAAVDREAARRRLGLDGKLVVGFAGSFAKWHRVDLLVQACSRLVDEFPDLRLLLVGDGAMRGATEEQIAAAGMTDRVVFTGKIPHAAVAEHMAAMDVGVMPASNVFGSPVKIYEYMAMGAVPVGPRYGPVEEAIAEGEDGLIFQPDDLESLVEALRQLLADESGRRGMAEAGRRKVFSQHLWQHNAGKVLELEG